MRFLHTADWHLGRQFHNVSLLEDQAHVLDQLVSLAKARAVDAVVIAGDVYDRAVPPAPAVSLLNDVLERLVPPGRISVLFIKTPRPDEEKQLERMALRRLTEDDVPHLGSTSLDDITWSIVSGFKGLENDVVILAALTNIETDWHQGVAYVGMSRARTRLHVIIQEDCDGKRREREVEWEARGEVMWRCCCEGGDSDRTKLTLASHRA